MHIRLPMRLGFRVIRTIPPYHHIYLLPFSGIHFPLVIPLNRLRVFGSKFYTIAAGRKRKSSMLSLFRKIIAKFILKSALIVLSSVISMATGFVVHRIPRPIWQCVVRHSRFLGTQSPSRRSVHAISSGLILPHIYIPRCFG